MASVYFFKIDDKIEYNTLPPTVLEHCKKPESKAAANALIEMGAKNLHYEENGKPICDNGYVSISHSRDMVAVCKSDFPVGIDIELCNKNLDWQKLANRYFSSEELEYLSSNSCEDTFLELWTKKEAFSKISGNGIKDIFKKVNILSVDDYVFQTEKVDNFIISICEKAGV